MSKIIDYSTTPSRREHEQGRRRKHRPSFLRSLAGLALCIAACKSAPGPQPTPAGTVWTYSAEDLGATGVAKDDEVERSWTLISDTSTDADHVRVKVTGRFAHVEQVLPKGRHEIVAAVRQIKIEVLENELGRIESKAARKGSYEPDVVMTGGGRDGGSDTRELSTAVDINFNWQVSRGVGCNRRTYPVEARIALGGDQVLRETWGMKVEK